MKNKNKNRDLQKRKKHWEGQRRCHEMQNKTQIGEKTNPKEFQKEPCNLGLA
jgi:hypothetical protein